ncbi:MAG: ketopantoate reductase C-terminal domain-containing protein, partial [Candidatus Binatia bacterium]
DSEARVGKVAGVRFKPLSEYDPLAFHPSRSYEARLLAFDEMARKWKSYDRKGPVHQLGRGLKTEVDHTVGHVTREASNVAVPTPICQALVRMIHEIEGGNRSPQIHNYAELARAVD